MVAFFSLFFVREVLDEFATDITQSLTHRLLKPLVGLILTHFKLNPFRVSTYVWGIDEV